ncbi:MAG: GntR family transcriptional regulator [Bacteroidales bacterium]
MNYKIDHKSAIPLHVQVENLLREMIKDPEYAKGKFLPNEVDLAKLLGISRNTLRQAANKLVYEGLLIRKKGVGTSVADISINTRLRNWLSFSQEMKALGIEITNYELTISWIEADQKHADFFRIPLKKKILKLERLRGRPEGPFVYFISFFHPRIGLTGKEDFSQPLYEILEKKYATVAKLSKEEISAIAADEFLANKLRLQPGDPILKRKRYVYDPGSRPIEYNLGYYRADSFVYSVESEREL